MAGLQDENRESFDDALAKANELERKKAEAKDSAAPVDINDPIALKGLAMSALEEIVRTAPRNVSLVAAIRELVDRCEGKAPQAIHMRIERKPVELLSDDRLASLLAMCKEPILIPPMPKKTEG